VTEPVIELESHIQGAPLSPPKPADRPLMLAPLVLKGGQDTKVAVLDSGITRNRWLEGSYAESALMTSVDQWDLSSAILPRHVGHGTFVAGIVRRYAPQARILPVRVIDLNGDSHDDVLGGAIRGLIGDDPDVLNLSLGPGHHAEDGTQTRTPKTTDAIAELQQACGTIVVVSAGYKRGENDYRQPWPQSELASPGERTVIVGALDAKGEPAGFSDDRGVGIWARGEDVPSSFVYWTGIVEQGETPDDDGHEELQHAAIARQDQVVKFKGWARWTGTSFAAPAVAGAVAAAISHQDGDDHARRLRGFQEVMERARRNVSNSAGVPVLDAASIVFPDPHDVAMGNGHEPHGGTLEVDLGYR
jgi:subtilisin family serine protease